MRKTPLFVTKITINPVKTDNLRRVDYRLFVRTVTEQSHVKISR